MIGTKSCHAGKGRAWVAVHHEKYKITKVNLAPVDDLEHDAEERPRGERSRIGPDISPVGRDGGAGSRA